jgi:hypothetical protein
MRAPRDDLPRHGDQDIPAPRKPEGVMTVGAGTGAHGHSGGQWPGLDLNVSHPAGLASVILPLDRTSRASLDDTEDERG